MGGAFWVTIIFLILTGILATASMIVAKRPDAATAINKLVPFQGIIGVLALIWGIWSLIQLLSSGMLNFFGVIPVTILLSLAACVLMILLGFLFGWGLISKLTGGSQGGAAAAKLGGIQGPLGIATIIVALLLLIIAVFRLAI